MVMSRSQRDDDVAAVFSDRPHATAAVEDLCAADADVHLRVAAQSRERRIYEMNADGELSRSVRAGILAGMPLGAILGIVIVLLATRGDVELVRVLAAGGLPGLLGGLLFGGFAGMLRVVWLQEDVDDWADLRLDDEEVLVVARAHGHAEQVRQTLERHGGRFIPAAHA